MSWDTAASNAQSRGAASSGLRAPLLDGTRNVNGSAPRPGGRTPSGKPQPPPASSPSVRASRSGPTSTANDQIAHGEGPGLRLMYDPKNEEEFERAMMEERERDIVQTTQNIIQVNEVFQEVAALVSAQQAGIDQIESGVVTAAERTEAGRQQLQSALDGQKKLNSCYIYILLFLFVVLVCVMVFVFWGKITGSTDDK